MRIDQDGLVYGIFDEWRLANKLAVDAEAIVLTGLLRVLDGSGASATEQEIAEAKRLRAIANDLFEIGMREMAERARRLKR